MRGSALLSVAAVFGVLAVGGCSASRHAAAADSHDIASAAPRAQHRAPAPADPDLASVMERFYQQVEGAHWTFAYAMLSPRYRATLSQTDLMDRYDDIANLNVTLRQTTGTSVTAWLDGEDRTDRSRSLHFEDTVTLAWDGEQWLIDGIARRDVTAGTR